MITPDVDALRKRFAFPGMRILQFAWGDGESAERRFLPHRHEPDTRGLHRQPRQRHHAGLVGQRRRGRAPPPARVPGQRRHARSHWDLIRAACRQRGRHRRRADAGRDGPGRRAPHELPRPRRGQLGLALRLARRAGRRRGAPAPLRRALRPPLSRHGPGRPRLRRAGALDVPHLRPGQTLARRAAGSRRHAHRAHGATTPATGTAAPRGCRTARCTGSRSTARRLPDPASRYQPQGVHGPSMVGEITPVRTPGWRGVAMDDAIIYELHLGTFTPEGTLAAATAKLPYLRDARRQRGRAAADRRLPGRAQLGLRRRLPVRAAPGLRRLRAT